MACSLSPEVVTLTTTEFEEWQEKNTSDIIVLVEVVSLPFSYYTDMKDFRHNIFLSFLGIMFPQWYSFVKIQWIVMKLCSLYIIFH